MEAGTPCVSAQHSTDARSQLLECGRVRGNQRSLYLDRETHLIVGVDEYGVDAYLASWSDATLDAAIDQAVAWLYHERATPHPAEYCHRPIRRPRAAGVFVRRCALLSDSLLHPDGVCSVPFGRVSA